MGLSSRAVVMAIAVGSSAAGCEIVASLGDYSAANVQGDAGMDAASGDAVLDVAAEAAQDASVDVAADGSFDAAGCEAAFWCGCNTPSGGYCLDFDEPVSPLGVFGIYDSIGAAAFIGPNASASTSPPDSLLVSFAPNTTGFTNVLIQSALGAFRSGGPITFDLAFDVRFDSEMPQSGTPRGQVVNMGVAASNGDLSTPPRYLVWFGVDSTGNVRLGDYSSASGQGFDTQPAPPPPPPAQGTWHHVVMHVTFADVDAGELDFAFDDAGSTMPLHPSVVSGYPNLQIGVPYADQNWGGAVRVDDVTVVAQ